MGMFDYIRCEVELPNGKRNVLDQTKEFDCVLLHHKIDSLGQLWLDRSDTIDDESSQKLVKNNDFTGSIEIDDYYLIFYKGQLDEFESSLNGELTRFRKPTYEDQADEIASLKEQLARTERERDGLSEFVVLREQSDGFELEGGIVHFTYVTEGECKHTWRRNGKTINNPNLFAHLAGKVEG